MCQRHSVDIDSIVPTTNLRAAGPNRANARDQDLNPLKVHSITPRTVETISQRHPCADGSRVEIQKNAIYSVQLDYSDDVMRCTAIKTI